MALPALLRPEGIRARLPAIFPDGTPNRGKVVTLMSARTIFVALYIGATEGGETVLQPKPVYRMTEEQAELFDEADRRNYMAAMRGRGSPVGSTRWYQDNSREGIRDDTIREGLVTLGAVIVQSGVATTANKPRYVLAANFAALFDPALDEAAFAAAAAAWQAKALNKGALARIAINRKGAGAAGDKVLVTFPNGETRLLKPGPSSDITKAVVEVFAARFLEEPAVIFVSESGNKVVSRDDELAKKIGLNIEADKDLPDTILVDLGPQHPLLVFVEVVATDGPINERRKAALRLLVEKAGFPAEHVAFVTAFQDRSAGPFKKTVDNLAWGSYAWFMAEPEKLLLLSDMTTRLVGNA